MKTKSLIVMPLVILFTLGTISAQKINESNLYVDKKCKIIVDKMNEFVLSHEQQIKNDQNAAAELGNVFANQLINLGMLKGCSVRDLIQVCTYSHVCTMGAVEYKVMDYAAPPDYLKDKDFNPKYNPEYYIEPQLDVYKISCSKPRKKVNIKNTTTNLRCEEYLVWFNASMTAISRHLGFDFVFWKEGEAAYTTLAEFRDY